MKKLQILMGLHRITFPLASFGLGEGDGMEWNRVDGGRDPLFGIFKIRWN